MRPSARLATLASLAVLVVLVVEQLTGARIVGAVTDVLPTSPYVWAAGLAVVVVVGLRWRASRDAPRSRPPADLPG